MNNRPCPQRQTRKDALLVLVLPFSGCVVWEVTAWLGAPGSQGPWVLGAASSLSAATAAATENAHSGAGARWRALPDSPLTVTASGAFQAWVVRCCPAGLGARGLEYILGA